MSLSLKQGQTLAMTPQLQQAIKLLTLTHLEMTSLIAQEMVENPMLEESGGEISAKEMEASERENQETTSESFEGPKLVEGVEGEKEHFEWDKYADSFNSSSSAPPTKENFSKEDQPSYENMVSRGESLPEHLEWQLRMENLTEDELQFALNVIHNIDDDGYLEVSIEELLSSSKLEREDALEIVKMIRNLDPVGCGSTTLEECLLAQAQVLEERSALVELMIKNHLKDLESKDYRSIQQTTGVDLEKIKSAELIIHSLNPKPGKLISNEEIQYVVPDIYVKDIGGELVIQLNDDGVPRLKVSNLYKNLLKSASSDEKANEYVQDKLRAAMWLIKSIENRQKTIEKVAHAIVKYQPEFFRKGTAFLKPMILKDIANQIGMHESTVSRVTTNKFMHTPLGTFELKFFFNSGIGGKNGGIDIAAEGLKIKIKELILKEDPKRPISDQKISELLSDKDIVVARRTVAKYRDMLSIPPASKRKRA